MGKPSWKFSSCRLLGGLSRRSEGVMWSSAAFLVPTRAILLEGIISMSSGESFGRGQPRGNYFSSIFLISLLSTMSFKNLLCGGLRKEGFFIDFRSKSGFWHPHFSPPSGQIGGAAPPILRRKKTLVVIHINFRKIYNWFRDTTLLSYKIDPRGAAFPRRRLGFLFAS